MRALAVGARAPDFEAPNQDGATFRFSDLRGRWVVLYFYPKDETRGCTAEACAFRDEMPKIAALGAQIVGVSRDGVASHGRFAKRHGLRFPLIADPSGRIARDYGALWWFGALKRVTFVIDPEGMIRRRHLGVRPGRHAREVSEELDTLVRTSSGKPEHVRPFEGVSAGPLK